MQSKGRSFRGGCIVASVIGTLFAGLATWLLLVRPVNHMIAARSWKPTACQVISSEVVQQPRSVGEGVRYKIEIKYRYTYGGRTYTSNSYDVMGFSGTSGYRAKAKVVARYPPGTATTCYVNPKAPQEALLIPGFTVTMLWGLLPLFFLVVFGAGFFVAVFLME